MKSKLIIVKPYNYLFLILQLLNSWLCLAFSTAHLNGISSYNTMNSHRSAHAQLTNQDSVAQEYDEQREDGILNEEYYLNAESQPLDNHQRPTTARVFPILSTKHNAPSHNTKTSLSSAMVFEQGETRDFLRFLRRIRYDHRQCPVNNGGPVEIGVSIVVSNIRAVSEVTMDYALELFYRETWIDSRLDYDKELFGNKSELALHESYVNFLWYPDTFIPNAIASKNPQKHSISHRSLLRLREKGQMLYSRRISIVAECPMDLTLFPFDSQACKLGIESYGYTADKVLYKWLAGDIAALTLQKIRLPDFQIRQAFVTSQLETYATGNYSRLYVCFIFKRASGFCFLQLIIPSTAVVITSWVALWMESETEFQDMISIILAITFLIFSYNEMMPRVSYLKALDIWLAVCFMIVFLSLIKLALLKYMRQRLRETEAAEEAKKKADRINDFIPSTFCEIISDDPSELNLDFNAVDINGLNIQNLKPNDPKYFDSSFGLKENASNIQLNNRGTVRRYSRISLINCKHNGCDATSIIPTTQFVRLDGRKSHRESSKMRKKNFAKTTATVFLRRFRLTGRTMNLFHWVTQMIFFLGFIIFALFYFLLYPHLYYTQVDSACLQKNAESYAEIL